MQASATAVQQWIDQYLQRLAEPQADAEAAARDLLQVAERSGCGPAVPLRALLLRLGDRGSSSDSPSCRVLSALLQHLAPQPAFPTALCSALATKSLGAQFAGSLLRDRLQAEPQLQLITSLSILEAAPDDGLGSTGRARLAEALHQPWATDAVAGLPQELLRRLVAALAADPAAFGAQLKRLAAECPALQRSRLEPSLLALLPQPAEQGSSDKDDTQRLAHAAASAAAISAAAAAMAGDGASDGSLSSSGSLAPLLEQLGHAATASDAAAAKVVAAAGELSPRPVAAALGLMARTREGLAPRMDDAPAGLASALSGLSLDDGQAGGWKPEVLIDAIKSRAPGLDWSAVAEALDQQDFSVPDQASLALLAAAFRRAGCDGVPLPAVLNRVWTHSAGQLSLLRAAAAAPPDVFSFAASPRKQPPVEGLANGAPANGTPNEAWLSLDLLETLARLSGEGGNHAGVRAVLEAGAAAAPEVLLLGFAQARADWGPLQREVGDALAANYVAGNNPNSGLVLGRLWGMDADIVMRAMCVLYERDPTAVFRVLDVSQEVKGLATVLERTPYPLAIELAALAAGRGALSLQPWLQERLAACGLPFLQAALHFLAEKLGNSAILTSADGPPQVNGKVTVTLEGVATVLRVLQEKLSVMPEGAASALKQIHSQAMSAFPALAGLLVPAGEAAGGPDSFPPEIEEEANNYFQAIYGGQLAIPAVVDMLARFRDSATRREQQVFSCMVHNLFDEYQFFTKYPDKELKITAVLFGSLVRRRLVSGGALATALRCVAEAARSPPGSKLSKFALEALAQFRDELSSWPDFCATLLQTEHLRQADPEMASAVERAMAGRAGEGGGAGGLLPEGLIATEPEAAATPLQPTPTESKPEGDAAAKDSKPPAVPPPRSEGPAPSMNAAAAPFQSRGSTGGDSSLAFPRGALGLPEVSLRGMGSGNSTSSLGLPSGGAAPAARGLTFATINAETLETAAKDADFPVPSEAIIDKVHFIVNNLSTANLESKSRDLKDLLPKEFWPWFANYMVVKRAAQEPNFHGLYLALLDKLGDRKLVDSLVATTHKYIRILLASDRIKTHTSERSLLKNLGTWLGSLTLARNQALRHNHLDVKAVIADAYEQGKMIAVLPFVGKILEATKDSKSYRPSNPWVMGIMALLAEIYALDRLKLNLKFEIEMVFRNLGLQISDVKSADLLAKRTRLQGVDNPDFTVDKAALPPVPARPEAGAAAAVQLPRPPPPEAKRPGGTPLPQESVQLPGPGGMDQGLFANLAAFVAISPSLGLLSERLQLKRVVPVAVDRAICEIITPVVERSVTIACMTTKELVVKDFAMEPDENVVRQAAHAMVRCLAGSLALVTCKEPLRSALAQHLRQLLQVPGLEPTALDNAVNTVTADNLDLGCRMIEKAAHDKAITDIDARLAAGYSARKNAKAAGQAFYDVQVLQALAGTLGSALPESLRPRASALSPHQSRLYADYGRIRAKEEPTSSGGATTGSSAGGQQSPPAGAAGGLGSGLNPSAAPQRPPFPPTSGPGLGGMPSTGLDGEQGMSQEAPAAAAATALQEKYGAWQQRLDQLISQDPQADFGSLPEGAPLRTAAIAAASIPTPGPQSDNAALAVARKVFGRLLETAGARAAVGAYAAALVALAAGPAPRLQAELTTWYIQVEDDRKYRFDVGEALIRGALLRLPELDAHLAPLIGAGASPSGAVSLVLELIKAAAGTANPPLAIDDLPTSTNALARLAAQSSGGAPLLQLLEQARRTRGPQPTAAPAGPPPGEAPTMPRPGSRQGPAAAATGPPADAAEPDGFRNQVALLFDRWAALVEENPAERVHAPFVSHLQQAGFLKGDETTDRFLRVLLELAVAHCLASEAGAAGGPAAGGNRPGALSFLAVDAAARLLVTLISAHGGGAALLARALSVMTTVLRRDAEERGEAFNARPYFRLCVGLISELAPAAGTEDAAGFGMLAALASAFAALQPLRVPGFAFSWLELISHRHFMPAMLMYPGNRGWPAFQALLRGLLRFLEPYLRNAQLTEAIRLLYKGTLRVLLVLLHDFPELLCEYHFALCDCVPPSCIQMRNLLLSAFPRAMRLPDPFTPNLKVDLLPEIAHPPRFQPHPDALLERAPGLKAEVDGYLSVRQPGGWLSGLRGRLLLPPGEVVVAGTHYDVPLINALVFYIGIRAIEAGHGVGGTASAPSNPPLDIFSRLAADLDTEGRYLFLNALANQLRYPNSHTHYFSCVLLFLFAEAQQEIVQEQITRVLLERLIVNRPHPWGLLITFIELIKNPRYSFWTHSFTHCAPEIDRLFESVARSCMGPTAPPAGEEPQPEPVMAQ